MKKWYKSKTCGFIGTIATLALISNFILDVELLDNISFIPINVLAYINEILLVITLIGTFVLRLKTHEGIEL